MYGTASLSYTFTIRDLISRQLADFSPEFYKRILHVGGYEPMKAAHVLESEAIRYEGFLAGLLFKAGHIAVFFHNTPTSEGGG
jgi:hypothetical protein